MGKVDANTYAKADFLALFTTTTNSDGEKTWSLKKGNGDYDALGINVELETGATYTLKLEIAVSDDYEALNPAVECEFTVTAATPRTTTPSFIATTATPASAIATTVQFTLSEAINDATWKVYDTETGTGESTRAEVRGVDGEILTLASVNGNALASGTYYVTAKLGTDAESERVELTVNPAPSYLGANSNTVESGKITEVTATADLANLSKTEFMPITFTNPSTLYVFYATGAPYTSKSLGVDSVTADYDIKLTTDESGILSAQIKIKEDGQPDGNTARITLLGAEITVEQDEKGTP